MDLYKGVDGFHTMLQQTAVAMAVAQQTEPVGIQGDQVDLQGAAPAPARGDEASGRCSSLQGALQGSVQAS